MVAPTFLDFITTPTVLTLALLFLLWACPRPQIAWGDDIRFLHGCMRNVNGTFPISCVSPGCHLDPEQKKVRAQNLQDKISNAKIEIFNLEQKEIVDRKNTFECGPHTNGTKWWNEKRYVPLHNRIHELRARIQEWEKELKQFR